MFQSINLYESNCDGAECYFYQIFELIDSEFRTATRVNKTDSLPSHPFKNYVDFAEIIALIKAYQNRADFTEYLPYNLYLYCVFIAKTFSTIYNTTVIDVIMALFYFRDHIDYIFPTIQFKYKLAPEILRLHKKYTSLI